MLFLSYFLTQRNVDSMQLDDRNRSTEIRPDSFILWHFQFLFAVDMSVARYINTVFAANHECNSQC